MALAHTDRAYEAQLKELRDKLLSMGGKVDGFLPFANPRPATFGSSPPP
jgi:hypothetical protein